MSRRCVTSRWCAGAQREIRDEEDKEAKARRVVRANNFTQQTNALDVDKHMCVVRPILCAWLFG